MSGWRRLLPGWRAPRAHIVHGRRYGLALPGTQFDAQRAERILAFLDAKRLLARARLHRVRPAALRALRRVHGDDYLESLQARGALAGILGFDVDDALHDAFLVAQRAQTGGTLLATRLALSQRIPAINLGGGFHHALPDRGQGFCAFNDVAVAIAERRASGFSAPVLVVDLDLHDGDGTRAIFAADHTVHTYSVHNRHLGPVEAVESSALALGDDVDDRTYLGAVRDSLPAVVERFRPALVFYLAGVDPALDDQLGNWRVSTEGLVERDRLLLDLLRRQDRRVPLVVLLAGGYGRESWRHSARMLSLLLFDGRRVVEPPGTGELTLAHYRRIAAVMREAQLTAEPPESDWSLTPEDVDPRAAAARRATRFLDYYSRHGIELALERNGFLDKLRRLGHETIRLELQLDDPPSHTLRVLSDDHGGQPLVELRLRRDQRAVPGMTLLAWEWLLLQNPAAEFTARRPRLPGQQYPGLGMLRDVTALLVLVCERLQLDGLTFVPAHYHIAAQTGAYFHFLEPRAQARFTRLRETLSGMRLVDAIQALAHGRVRHRDTDEPFVWQPSAMVLPVSQRLRARLQDEAYSREVERELQQAALVLR